SSRLLALFEHLDECGDFRFQDLWDKWFEDVVHAAKRVALADVDVAFADRGEENDGRVVCLLSLADQRGRLKAVHIRHFDVEKNNSHLILEKILQSLPAGRGLHKVLVQVSQNPFERNQIFPPVIDQQNVDLVGHKKKDFEIGRILHLKSEIRSLKLD